MVAALGVRGGFSSHTCMLLGVVLRLLHECSDGNVTEPHQFLPQQ